MFIDKLTARISEDACDAVRETEVSISLTVFTIPDRLNTDCDTDIALLYAESDFIDTIFNQLVVVCKLDETHIALLHADDFIDTIFNQSVVVCKLDETVSRTPLDHQ